MSDTKEFRYQALQRLQREGLSYAQIGRQLGLKRGSVASQLSRARDKARGLTPARKAALRRIAETPGGLGIEAITGRLRHALLRENLAGWRCVGGRWIWFLKAGTK